MYYITAVIALEHRLIRQKLDRPLVDSKRTLKIETMLGGTLC